MNKPKSIFGAAIGLGAVAIFSVTALASTGGGFSGTPQVRGTLTGDVKVNADRIKFQTKGATDVVVQTVTYTPGGFSGWHTHPGFVLVVVESGALTLQVGCSINTYSVGDSFYESGTTPIMARNLGTSPAVGRITYIVPHGSPVRREVALSDAPTC
jgi:quercetin dioxygenase-like cupin family protein